MAFFFGASADIAIFMVAYRFANLLRRLLGEGTFQSGFIPYYESLKLESLEKSSKFYRDLIFSMALLLTIVIAIGEVGLYFAGKKIISSQVVYLTQIMLPGLFFICMYALNSSFLQCHGKYFLPSFSPAIFNIVWILSVILFKDLPSGKFIYVLSIVVVVAFGFQYITGAFASFSIIFKNISLFEFFRFKLFSKQIIQLVKPVLLSMLGIGAMQINSALDAIFASFADISGPAYLWYAIRLYQLPLALFGIAMASAILPPLSRAYKMEDNLNFKKFFNLGLEKSFALMMPSTVGLIIMSYSFVNLVYRRGAFDMIALMDTSSCLIAYSLGLVFSSFVMIVTSCFYAKKSYFIPTFCSISAVFMNIFLNYIFVFAFHFKSFAIALSTSISCILNFLLLVWFLKKEFTDIFEKTFLKNIFKIFTCSIFAAGACIAFGYFVNDGAILLFLKKPTSLPISLFSKAFSFFSLSTIFIGFLLFGAYIAKIDTILELFLRKQRFLK